MIVYPLGRCLSPPPRLCCVGLVQRGIPGPATAQCGSCLFARSHLFARPARRLPARSSLQKKSGPAGDSLRPSIRFWHESRPRGCMFFCFLLCVCVFGRTFFWRHSAQREQHCPQFACHAAIGFVREEKKEKSCRGRRHWRPAACDVTGTSSLCTASIVPCMWHAQHCWSKLHLIDICITPGRIYCFIMAWPLRRVSVWYLIMSHVILLLSILVPLLHLKR